MHSVVASGSGNALLSEPTLALPSTTFDTNVRSSVVVSEPSRHLRRDVVLPSPTILAAAVPRK